MEIKQSNQVAASCVELWDAIRDPDVLKACVPFCEVVDQLSEIEYRLHIRKRVTLITVAVPVALNLKDAVPAERWTIEGQADNRLFGQAVGRAKVQLEPVDGKTTTVNYQVSADLGERLNALVGDMIVTRAAPLAADFFERLAAEIAKRR